MLALEERVVTHNVRISVVHEDMRTWRLRIKQLRESDRGCYMCQINASPMRKQIGCIDVQGESVFRNLSFRLITNFSNSHSESEDRYLSKTKHENELEVLLDKQTKTEKV